jgi:hypothetical protein
MTIETLKSSRNEIIEIVSNLYGADKLKFMMEAMVERINSTDCEDVNEFITETAEEFGVKMIGVGRRSTKNAELLGKLAEMEK